MFAVASNEYKVLKAELTAQIELTQVRFSDSQMALQAALLSQEKAITKAELSAEKRFEAVNEFRKQLSDQASTFATKEALDSWSRESRTAHEALSNDIQKVENTINQYHGRDASKAESKTLNQWGVVMVISVVNIISAAVVHFIK